MSHFMKLYHSHADKALYHFADVPNVDPRTLTAESTVAEACCAFIHHDLSLVGARKAGKHRGHEPYCAIANGEYGKVKIKDFTRRTANLLVSDLYSAGKAGGTINGITSKYRRLFRWLYWLELVTANPFDAVQRAPKTEPKRATRCLTNEEIQTVLAALSSVKSRCCEPGTYADIFELGLLTAMRYGEILSLTPASLILTGEEPTAHVTAAYSKTKQARDVVLSPRAAMLLSKYVRPEMPEDNKLFAFSYSALQERLNELKDKVGIHVFFHLTRHTAITNYAADAASMSEIQAFSGHTSKQGVEPYANHDMKALRDRVRAKLAKN